MKPNQMFCKHAKSWVKGKYACKKCGRQFRLPKEYFNKRRWSKIKAKE